MVSFGRFVPGIRASRLCVRRVSMVSAVSTDRVTFGRTKARKSPVPIRDARSATSSPRALAVSALIAPENSRSAAPGVKVRVRVLPWAMRVQPASAAAALDTVMTPSAPRRLASSAL
ncbi:hypothetical protein D3C85_1268820 [compost metagenome]